jgi:hypothetical protein
MSSSKQFTVKAVIKFVGATENLEISTNFALV